MLFVGVFADALSPYDPIVADYSVSRSPPTTEHVFGADHMGRDTLARIMHGARVSLFVALVSVFWATPSDCCGALRAASTAAGST